MLRRKPRRHAAGIALVSGVGSVLLVLHVLHFLEPHENLRTVLYGILVPMGLAGAVIVGAWWLWQSDFDGSHVSRIALWCLFGAVVFALGNVLMIRYQAAEDVVMSDQMYVLANAASFGGVVGLVTGVYNARQRRTRAHVERLNKQLTVLNRVLRHDIRNHSNVIRGRAELLADRLEDSHHVSVIERQASDLVELGDHAREIEQLLTEDDDHHRTAVDLTSLLADVIERVGQEHPDAHIDVSLPDSAQVSAHPLVESAVDNLLVNAVEHNDSPQPHVWIECARDESGDEETVSVRIVDDGPGIPAADLAVLERGYETPLEHTRGLGLWLSNWIVSKSGGRLDFGERDDGGTVVELQLPAATSQ
ncbi:sensor histidine kinase [Halorhabdus salina]|uniref:sensor histidine kinase n=1 Tax=Halorhabdus salina TaxID=2750670 RepID=UPI0015EF1C4E|nr:HAMP domain-containing sensor histidine kinase [Halorhabdus salina]